MLRELLLEPHQRATGLIVRHWFREAQEDNEVITVDVKVAGSCEPEAQEEILMINYLVIFKEPISVLVMNALSGFH